jgi:hypothetical protein
MGTPKADMGVVRDVLMTLVRHPDWTKVEQEAIEQELDIPVADYEEEEDGYFMARYDRVKAVAAALRHLIKAGHATGAVEVVEKVNLQLIGVKITQAGRAHAKGL